MKAEKRFSDVRRFANSLLSEVEPQLSNQPGATGARQTLVKHALEYLDSLASEAGEDRSLQQELGEAYLGIANIQGNLFMPNLGDTAGAILSCQKAEAIFASLLVGDPTNRAVQRDLAYAYQFMGQALGDRTRDLNGNLENQPKAVTIFQSLVSANPGNSEDRLDLVTVYNYLATAMADHAQASQSHYRVALEHDRKAKSIYEALSTADPTNLRIPPRRRRRRIIHRQIAAETR